MGSAGKVISSLAGAVALALVAQAVQGATMPEETVKQYLKAMQEHRFEDAYSRITKKMAGSKDKEVWAKEWKYVFDAGEAKILGYELFPVKVEGETAQVACIISSQDKALNALGADEYSVFTLIKKDGEWLIDGEEQLEKPDSRFKK